MKIYGDMQSGNCYKVALLCAFLDVPHEWIHTDILKGQTQSLEFEKLNPNKKIPLIVLEDNQTLWESNAILNYLAEGTDFLPESTLDRARVLQWQFFEQYSHEPFIAVARYINVYLGMPDDRKQEFEMKQAGGNKALSVMEQHLKENQYFVGDSLTIADISLFAYTHVAHEGGFDLGLYPAIQQWIDKIKADPKFIPMS
ncbi:glutathione S-transferase family protein [Glaciecola sp. 1036]|uniref:glutathione S-transferase family protein n=1 Tax=Alteromonadaceae TaxID=72275 RepID=UPI003CFCA61B